MPGIELEAFLQLEKFGCLKDDEYYSPGKAEERFYSEWLRHVQDLRKLRTNRPSTKTILA